MTTSTIVLKLSKEDGGTENAGGPGLMKYTGWVPCIGRVLQPLSLVS